jgi:hypothetical protein
MNTCWAISWWLQVVFRWYYYVFFALEQRAQFDFYSARSLLKQHSADIHGVPLWHIILIPSQPVLYEFCLVRVTEQVGERRSTACSHMYAGYIDDVLSLTNSRFWWFFYRIYSIGIEIKDISDTDRSVSHLDLHIKTESEERSKWWLQLSQ